MRTIGDTLGKRRLDEAVRQFVALSPLEQLAVAYLECVEDIPVGDLLPTPILSLGQIVAVSALLQAN